MVSARHKVNDSIGIQGYEHIKYDNHVDKPRVYSIAKPTGKKSDYISLVEKREKNSPGPTTYNQEVFIGKKPKFYMAKDQKIGTYFDEVMKNAKKYPGVGKYEAHKSMDRVKGTYTSKAPISGVMDEAQYKGMTSPSHYNAVNLNLIK